MKAIAKIRRRSSPTITPQALAWDCNHLWVSSRDLGTLYKIDVETWKIVDEIDPPGVVWAAVSSGNGEMYFTIGKGLNDDRYIYRYATNEGFTKLFACPDFTGSYLGFDGECLYMSQFFHLDEPFRVLDCSCDFQSVAHDPIVAEQPLHVSLAVARDLFWAKSVECFSVVLALFQNGLPAQFRLRAFRNQEFEKHSIVVQNSPFIFVISNFTDAGLETKSDS